RLWLRQQLEPKSAAYNVPLAVRLAGPLDATVLARSLSEVVRRHESLRTTFAAPAGRPVQIVAPPAPVSLPTISLTDLPEPERESMAERLAGREAARPFDLGEGPL